MKRIDGSDIWTDGVVKYKKNDAGELVIYVEEAVNIVTTDEEVVLKPVDNEEKD